MKNQSLIAAAVSALALLAACGGNDDSTGSSAAGIDRYVGTWSSCYATATGFEKDTFQLKRVSDTQGVIFDGKIAYQFADCSGTGTPLKASIGTLVFSGTTTIGGVTVDRALISESGFPPDQKQVYLVQGTAPATLTSGRMQGPVDADGYPATLDSVSLTKEGTP